VTAGSLRPPRPTPVDPACPVFMGLCTLAGAPRRLPRRCSAPPLDDSPSRARVTPAPAGGGEGRATPGAPAARPVWPAPATPPHCTLAGAPRRLQQGARNSRPGGGLGGGAILGNPPPTPGPPGVAHLGHTGPPDTPPCPPHGDGACPLGPGGPPPHDPGRPWPAPTAAAPGPHTGGMLVSRLGPPETLGQVRPLALGRRDGDPFRRGNCDGRKPGPHTRGTSSLPVKRGHVDSRDGRSHPVSLKRPLALARGICPTDAYFESFRWRSTCDRPMTHQPQPRSRDFPGTRKSPGRPPVKGLILCKPDLDH